MEKLSDILFYSLEKSIKCYRQFAQRRLVENGFDITIDQWLVLKSIGENPEWTQQQIGEAIFKDLASITRMIDLLVKKKYIKRGAYVTDRRRFSLSLTDNGLKMLKAIQPVIEENRRIALNRFDTKQVSDLERSLNMIIDNCKY